MKFTDLFIRRPVLATVVSLLILLVGLQSMLSLNVRQYPVSNSAVVTVTTVYTGASADLIRGFITTPLEKEIASADGIDYMESTSSPNASTITVHLRLNYDPNAALTQITSKVNRVRNQLPAGSEDPTIDVQVGETTASMYLSFSSDTLESNQITDYLTRVVQPKLVSVPGVQSAQVLGGRVFAMRIWLKPDRMAALGVSPSQVNQALRANNALAAVGATKGSVISVNLNAATNLHTADEFKQLVVGEHNGTIIRISDVADVVLGAESYESTVSFNGKTATFIGINVLPTANALTVIKDVRKVLPEMQQELPTGMSLTIPYDATAYINDSINEVIHTLVEALVIVVIVIFLFLGSVRSVVIPIVAMPLSLVGAFFLMLVLGFTINLLTLLAMVLAIGLVVDDAIVVVENIHRHIEEGLSPFAAALKGAQELAGPVIAMTITLAAVYAPIGFMGGLTGSLFKEFAFTLAGAVIVSGVVALTLTPMMCSKILKHDPSKRGFAHFLDTTFDKLRLRYERMLHGALDYRPVTVVFAIIVLLACIPFLKFSKSELAPDEDQGIVIAVSNAAPNANIDQTTAYAQQIIADYKTIPEKDNIFQIVGLGSSNSALTGLVLKPWSERKRTTMDLLPVVTNKLNSIAGLQSFAFLRPPLPGGGSGAPVQFVIKSTDDPQNVAEVARNLVGEAMKSGMFYYSDSDLKFDQPQMNLEIDRDKAADLGVNMAQLAGDVGSMLGGGYVNRFDIQGNSYRVIPQVERSQRLNPEQILDYQVGTGSGALVPLRTFATLQSTVQPQTLKRFQQLNSATISAVPRFGVSLGQALDWFKAEAGKTMPAGYQIDYAGQSRQYIQEGSALLVTFLFAVVIIFLVLAAQFESFRDPFVIMLTVPLAVSGALVFIFLGFASLNIYTEVGLITLVGLITKHGILIVQFANQLQEEGVAKREAIERACGVRLRPILMTTAAMVLGVLPLVLASGAGAASRYNMGLVIATGMTIGTLFTLLVVPTAYLLIAPNLAQTKHAAPVAPHA
ncbi:efflux RND transporter permease subunit [Horticoccus luteus]|uniref:Efflux RND transporter permease subunit n=1 Tax=Horticoccus luteus TaxID=2862869 RepID=A0A8F9TW78_9BACT|nr:efflux RND transporter permease subunit [Horticoccus luteus]QYM80220.1 efflux RND transporter permease subunit [Horticoccus luteus]